MIQKPKWEHPTLPMYEKVHIFKDPPKSVTSSKSEKVEFGDVSYMLRENPDRISDHIEYYSKNKNPMVSVSYNNHGEKSLFQGKYGDDSKNPYPVMKDGAFRFPIYGNTEDSLPLNRQKHPNYTVTAFPTAPTDVINNITPKHVDKNRIKSAIHPTASYNIGYLEHPWGGNDVLSPVNHYTITSSISNDRTLGVLDFNQNVKKGTIIKPSISVTSGASTNGVETISITDLDGGKMKRYIKDRPVSAYLSPVYNIAVELPGSNGAWNTVKLSEKDKRRIVSRIDSGKHIDIPIDGTVENIRLKKYGWMIHRAGPTTTPTLILSDMGNPGLTLNSYNKKTPHQAITSTLELKQMGDIPPGFHPTLTRNRPLISISSPVAYPDMVDNLSRDAKLHEKLRVEGSYFDRGHIEGYDRPNLNPGSHTIDPYRAAMNKAVREMHDTRFINEGNVLW